MRNSLMTTCRRTGDRTLRSSRGSSLPKATKKPSSQKKFSSFWKTRTPTQFSISIWFAFHMSGKLHWHYPATAIKSRAQVIENVSFLTCVSTTTLTDSLKIRSSHSYQTLSFTLSSPHRARPTLVMWNLRTQQ